MVTEKLYLTATCLTSMLSTLQTKPLTIICLCVNHITQTVWKRNRVLTIHFTAPAYTPITPLVSSKMFLIWSFPRNTVMSTFIVYYWLFVYIVTQISISCYRIFCVKELRLVGGQICSCCGWLFCKSVLFNFLFSFKLLSLNCHGCKLEQSGRIAYFAKRPQNIKLGEIIVLNKRTLWIQNQYKNNGSTKKYKG